MTTAAPDENGWTVANYDDQPSVDRGALHFPVSNLLGDSYEEDKVPSEEIEAGRVYFPPKLNRSATVNGQYDATKYDGILIT